MWIPFDTDNFLYIWVSGTVAPTWVASGTPPKDALIFTHVGYGKFIGPDKKVYVEKNATELVEIRVTRSSVMEPQLLPEVKETKAFNMRSRAIKPPEGAVVYTTQPPIALLAKENDIADINQLSSIPVDLSGFFLEMKEKGYLPRLIEPDCIYLHPASRDKPLTLRDPHPKSKAEKGALGKVAPAIQSRSGFDARYTITGPVKKVGKRKQTKSVMKVSAHPVMIEEMGSGQALNRHEWLHLIGHALGGADAMFNLGAGTFDANTWMIPLESAITTMSGFCTPEAPGWVRVRGEYLERSAVLSWLELSAGASNGWTAQIFVRAQETLAMDTFMYDYYYMKAQYSVGPYPQPALPATPLPTPLGGIKELSTHGIPREDSVDPTKSWLAALNPTGPPIIFSSPPPTSTPASTSLPTPGPVIPPQSGFGAPPPTSTPATVSLPQSGPAFFPPTFVPPSVPIGAPPPATHVPPSTTASSRFLGPEKKERKAKQAHTQSDPFGSRSHVGPDPVMLKYTKMRMERERKKKLKEMKKKGLLDNL
ncbi:MAG: hypothetical protein G3M70_02275 [Candidatus Nitronauta litoralis]|uniref:Uncharacterized protein n=1 Tax=Candidatus Nitronauta litoralis TaxID=2705533 RepID=A0A7T0BU02_9BACT|nr:MAG: hypothetical protein G3M70_02275 [Candidatus Nitronauta litoralis]